MYYNNLLRRIVLIVVILIVLLLEAFSNVEDIKCSQSENMCSIYSRMVVAGNPKLTNEFNFDDVEYHKIVAHRHHRRHRHYTSYAIKIYMKDGSEFEIRNRTRRPDRAERIFYDMQHEDNYILKGDYWKTLFENY